MSTIDLKTWFRRITQEFNKGKAPAMAVIDETCAPNIVFHDAAGTDTHGLQDFKQYMSSMYDAFPDLHMTIDDLIAEGDMIAARYRLTGTHKGEFMGIPPTNKEFIDSVIEIDRIAGGKIVEGWTRSNTLGFMQQLGLAPMPAKK